MLASLYHLYSTKFFLQICRVVAHLLCPTFTGAKWERFGFFENEMLLMLCKPVAKTILDIELFILVRIIFEVIDNLFRFPISQFANITL